MSFNKIWSQAPNRKTESALSSQHQENLIQGICKTGDTGRRETKKRTVILNRIKPLQFLRGRTKGKRQCSPGIWWEPEQEGRVRNSLTSH